MINMWQKYVNKWSALTTEHLRHDYLKYNHGFVLDEDDANVLSSYFNIKFIPQPYIGNFTAKHYVLMTNPSWHEFDIKHMGIEKIDKEFESSAFRRFELCLNQLTFSNDRNNENQFHLLNDEFSYLPHENNRIKTAYEWWKQRIFCKNPIVKSEHEIFVLQFFPYRSYKSVNIDQFSKKYALESAKYRNELLKNAIADNKIIYIMRSAKLWINEIPELKEYGMNTNNVFVAKNFQNATLSNSNMRSFKEWINER